MAHSRGLIPPGLVRVPERAGLPELGRVDFVVVHGRRRPSAQGAADALAAAILSGGDRLNRSDEMRPGGAERRDGRTSRTGNLGP
jgi:hypothetical protein